jgi:6,7-dimethyl-8-ribityllumazine synthase
MARYDISQRDYRVGDARFAIIAARFNAAVVDRLVEGARATLARHGVGEERLTLVRVPGAFEIPLAAQRLAAAGRHAAILTLGAVVRGETPHFDYVAGECARGVMRANLDHGVPVIFGILTTDDEAQALARAGGAAGHKGVESALAALEMVSLLRALDEDRGGESP